MDESQEISSLPEVISIEKVKLTKEIEALLGKTDELRARINNRHINVFVFRYISNKHSVSGFILIPKKIKNKLPVLIYNRGGTKDYGLIKKGVLFTDLADMSRWGSIILGSQYSGNVLSEGIDERGGRDVNDVMVLIKIAKKLSFIEKEKMAMYGASRGGMMTYRVLTRTSAIKTAIIVAGEADLIREVKTRPEMEEVFKGCFGGKREELRERSAIYWADKFKKKTSLLLIHGTSDDKVNYLDSVRLSKELKKYQIPHELILIPGGDHQLHGHRAEVGKLTFDWLKNKNILS